MKRLRVAVDPILIANHGPEIYWTLRLVLTGIGWTWEQVPLGGDCDIAYTPEPSRAPQARVCVVANPSAWSRPSAARLSTVGRRGSLLYPVFEGEAAHASPLEADANSIVCWRDLIFDVFWTVTGQEERHWPRDRHGFFDLTETATLAHQIPRRALASQVTVWLEETLRGLGFPRPVPRWPHGKHAAATVSQDVDYPEIMRWIEPLRVLRREGISGLNAAWEILIGRRNNWHFPGWVDVHRELGVRSAFYFVARKGTLWEYATGTPDPFYDITSERFRELFRYLADEGFEIGLQASYLAYADQVKFASEKARLERACGQQVLGNHHHYWHLNPDDVDETLRMHEDIGFQYDASLTHDRYVGWRRGLSQPFFPFHLAERRQLNTLQLPVAWMDDQLFGQRARNPGDRQQLLRSLSQTVVEQHGCLLIDIHDYVLDDVLYPGWALTYRRLWEYLLDRGDFWFATPGEVARHWISRHEAITRASSGLGVNTSESLSAWSDLCQPAVPESAAAALVL